MSVSESWALEVDLNVRDPNNLNDHLQVKWEDLFGEPDHTKSMDAVWRYSAKCFTMWKTLCYIISTAICGIPVATCWGCYFACVAFQHIWCITPCLRELAVELNVFQKMLKILSDACLTPCCESCGALFAPFANGNVVQVVSMSKD